MKRSALLTVALALAGAGSAEAQLTMQMGNGWNFTFAGNVNTFFTYENASDDGTTPGGIVGSGFSESRIRTGLLPAFAVFDAKGKEGITDRGVHFGFAPQVNNGDAVHDQFGAQIDMRQVYLTVGGSWGQLLVGREIGLFNRQNILTDQTLFGVGATGASGAAGSGVGTTLGRIGFGYIYPNFRAQITYSTPAGRPTSFSVGLFEATAVGDYETNELPRVEAEFNFNAASGLGAWVNGVAQSTKSVTTDESAAVFGVGGGLKFGTGGFSILGSGYYGKGIGSTLFGLNGSSDTGAGSDDLRTSYGYIGQVTFTPANSKVTLAGSYGSSILQANEDLGEAGELENNLISGGIYYQATKSLKLVGEFNYATSKDDSDATEDNTSIAPAVGFMLFF